MSARKKKPRVTRSRLTHIEVHRGDTLRLRLAITEDALAEAGDELGWLLRKIAPGAVSTDTAAPSGPALGALALVTPEAPSEFIVAPTHSNDDHEYHAQLRDRLGELFSSLCDASLTDALEIARAESARRAEVN